MEQRIYPTVTVNIDTVKIESCIIKGMDLEHYYKLRTSLRDYGQLRNILVDDQYNVVEGRKIAGVMKELGYKTIEAKVVPSDFIIPRLNLDSEYSTFDFVKVSVQLSKSFDLEKKDWLKDKLPFKNVDIDDYIESVQFSFDKFNSVKKQAQGTLFEIPVEDTFVPPPPAPVKEVEQQSIGFSFPGTEKMEAVAQTLFGDAEPPEIKPVEEEGGVTHHLRVVERVLAQDIPAVIGEEESFADRRAREVREAIAAEAMAANGGTQ